MMGGLGMGSLVKRVAKSTMSASSSNVVVTRGSGGRTNSWLLIRPAPAAFERALYRSFSEAWNDKDLGSELGEPVADLGDLFKMDTGCVVSSIIPYRGVTGSDLCEAPPEDEDDRFTSSNMPSKGLRLSPELESRRRDELLGGGELVGTLTFRGDGSTLRTANFGLWKLPS